MIRWISPVWRSHFALICADVFHFNFHYVQRTIQWHVNSFLFAIGSSVCVHSRYILPMWLLSIAANFRGANTPSHIFIYLAFLNYFLQNRTRESCVVPEFCFLEGFLFFITLCQPLTRWIKKRCQQDIVQTLVMWNIWNNTFDDTNKVSTTTRTDFAPTPSPHLWLVK